MIWIVSSCPLEEKEHMSCLMEDYFAKTRTWCNRRGELARKSAKGAIEPFERDSCAENVGGKGEGSRHTERRGYHG